MKFLNYYGNEMHFNVSEEYKKFCDEIKNKNDVKYDCSNIIVSYRIECLCIKKLFIPFSDIYDLKMENNKITVNYYYLREKKKVIIKDSQYINDIYKNLDEVIKIKNKYLELYLEKHRLQEEKYDFYVFMFYCNYKDLYLESKNKSDAEIADNISLVKNNENLLIKYKDKTYVITQKFYENLTNEELDRFQFCYLYMHEYKPDNYLLTLRLCKEK